MLALEHLWGQAKLGPLTLSPQVLIWSLMVPTFLEDCKIWMFPNPFTQLLSFLNSVCTFFFIVSSPENRLSLKQKETSNLPATTSYSKMIFQTEPSYCQHLKTGVFSPPTLSLMRCWKPGGKESGDQVRVCQSTGRVAGSCPNCSYSFPNIPFQIPYRTADRKRRFTS